MIISYSVHEAKRRAWEKKIRETPSNYIQTNGTSLKDELLGLLSHPNNEDVFDGFIAQRNMLLSENHGQKYAWTPHFTWFWNILNVLFGVKPRTGSRLREALLVEPEIPNHPIINALLPLTNTAEYLDDKAFETALFLTPKNALKNVEHDLNALEQKAKEKEKIRPDQSIINQVLERLHALRFHLNPIIYLKLLEQISQIAPKSTLVFLYKNQESPDQIAGISEHGHISFYMMAEILMKHAVMYEISVVNPTEWHCRHMMSVLLILDDEKSTKQLIVQIEKSLATGQSLADIINPAQNSLNDKTPLNKPKEYSSTLRLYFAYLTSHELFHEYKEDNSNVILGKSHSHNGCWREEAATHQGPSMGYRIVQYLRYLYTSNQIPFHIEPELSTIQSQLLAFLPPINPQYQPQGIDFKKLENRIFELIKKIENPKVGLNVAISEIARYRESLTLKQIDWILFRLKSYYPEETILKLHLAFVSTPREQSKGSSRSSPTGYGGFLSNQNKVNASPTANNSEIKPGDKEDDPRNESHI